MASPESRFYRSKELVQEMLLATKYLLSVQHTDGTIDLPATNFHSTPDTGFMVKRLASAYSILARAEVAGADAVLNHRNRFCSGRSADRRWYSYA